MTYLEQLRRTAERLSQLSDSRLLAHEGQYRQVLAALTPRPVPRVLPRAWSDQLWLVGRDLPEPSDDVISMLIELRRCFDLEMP
jgi:hypothetical protein